MPLSSAAPRTVPGHAAMRPMDTMMDTRTMAAARGLLARGRRDALFLHARIARPHLRTESLVICQCADRSEHARRGANRTCDRVSRATRRAGFACLRCLHPSEFRVW